MSHIKVIEIFRITQRCSYCNPTR